MNITEDNVVQHIKRRDEKAIAFMIQTYGGLLSAIIKHHVLYDRQEYEECLDDVLLAVWHQIDAFDEGRSTFKNWIAAIAKYRAIDYQRKMARSRQRFISTDITDELYRSEPEPPVPDVEEVLNRLSVAERAVFENYYLEGESTREMARRMKVKETWIHNILSRGRKKLKQRILPENEV